MERSYMMTAMPFLSLVLSLTLGVAAAGEAQPKVSPPPDKPTTYYEPRQLRVIGSGVGLAHVPLRPGREPRVAGWLTCKPRTPYPWRRREPVAGLL